MAIESPQTYAEWYWANSMQAVNAVAEEREKTFGPLVGDILADLGMQDGLPPAMLRYYNMLAKPTSPGWEDAQRMFFGVIGRAVETVAGDDMARPFKYKNASRLLSMQIDAEAAMVLHQRKKITDDFYWGRMHSAGYPNDEAEHLYKSRMPYPPIPDLITYARYHSTPDNPKLMAWDMFDIPADDWELWQWLSYQKPTTEQVFALWKRGTWDTIRTDKELARLGWPPEDRKDIFGLAYSLPNAMIMAQGSLYQEDSEEKILEGISAADIHPDYAKKYLDAILTKPATEDIVAFQLRRNPSLDDLPKELGKLGVHPDYHNVYKELAQQIPPVADIITMAVREAFTPSIAARFGQYEGLPSEFVEWVGKKGLTREWAERYWAAHWSLPSPSQGFEMLHRGIIGRDDLSLLLRALDIMPFWRDKLIEMAYTPFTRVDIRRMFNSGVLTETEVTDAYKAIGYNDFNADKLTAFTVKLKEAAEERAVAREEKAATEKVHTWTGAQTLKFLTMGLISRERAQTEFRLIGYNEERINVYLATIQVETAE